jgi:hypothetical protein
VADTTEARVFLFVPVLIVRGLVNQEECPSLIFNENALQKCILYLLLCLLSPTPKEKNTN